MLEAGGVACWIAPRDVQPGQDWSAAIPPAIDACKAMVLILSSNANASRQIAHEVHIAHNNGAPIVPLRIERVKPEGALRYLLSGIHYIDALEERNSGIDALTALLHRLDEGGDPGDLSFLPETAQRPRVARTNLPLQLTSFLGREGELERLRDDLRKTRLLTLAGTGGVGKTRLALELAGGSLDEYEHGVWFVDLAPIAEEDAVASAVATALSVRTSPGQSVIDALVTSVRDKQMLLLVDGYDRVRAAAAALVETLVRSCPNLRVVAASRQALEVEGESVRNVNPLADDEAIALFAERAKAASSTFEVTPENLPTLARICRRLDGIPLALELAAAKMRMISPRQLEEKLGERFRILSQAGRGRLPHQATLRATIDWSYDLLDERERMLFRRLAVFSGGATLPAATEVCTGDAIADDWELLETISSLVNKSMVTVESFGDDQRYRMLHSIREYGLERLAEAGETEAIGTRHARYYASLVGELEPLVQALEDEEWRRLLAPEVDNIRAAIEWTIFAQHEPAIGLSLLAQIEWPQLLITPEEALRWCEAAVALPNAMPDAVVHSRLLRHCVLLEWLVGRPLAEREQTALGAVEIARATGDANEIARALANLGGCYRAAARFDEAGTVFLEAYRQPELLSRITTNVVLRIWAVTDLQRNEVELARRRFSEVARLERPGSEAHASALLNLGELEFAAGNIEAARAAAREAKETYARLNSVYLVLLLSNLGAYAIAIDDLDDARMHLREALHLQRSSGRGWIWSVLEHHALLAALLGDLDRATVLVGFTDALYGSRGEVRQYTERRGYERLMRLLSEAYGADDLAVRMSAGAQLAEEQALAHAAAIHKFPAHAAAMPPRGE